MRISDLIAKGKRFLKYKREVAHMEWVDVKASTIEDVRAWEGMYGTSIPIKNKIYIFKNIALLKMPTDFDAYKKGKPMQAFRTNYNRGKKKGFACHLFCGMDYIDQIMEINLSKDKRTGHSMSDIYTHRDQVEAFLHTEPLMFGTFTLEGKLVGYLHLLYGCGVLSLNKILGHGEYLEDGVMYFMLGELISQIPDIYACGEVRYIRYGSWYGGVASSGLQYYKTRCGFCGYNIRYHVDVKREE